MVAKVYKWIWPHMAAHLEHPQSVNLFGLLLYTHDDAFVSKVVADPIFWESLNRRTGDKWLLFALQGEPSSRVHRIGEFARALRLAGSPDDNIDVANSLGLSYPDDFPCLLIFSILEQDQILFHKTGIGADSVDSAFAEMSSLAETVTVAASNITAVNRRNPEGIHAALQLALDNHRQWKMVRRVGKFLPLLRFLRFLH